MEELLHKGAMPWWTEDEERALLEGVERHGTGDQSWEKIKTDDDFSELLILRSCSSLGQARVDTSGHHKEKPQKNGQAK